MPIILDQINQTVMSKSHDAKFLNKKLTGKGKKSGILNDTKHPQFINPAQCTTNDNIMTKKRQYHNGDTTVNFIPLTTILYDMWDYMSQINIPPVTDMHHIGTTKYHDVYIQMKAHTLILEETEDNSGKTTRKLTPSYQAFLYLVQPNDTTAEKTGGFKTALGSRASKYLTDFTCNPLRLYSDWADKFLMAGANINENEIHTYINNYNLYDAICQRSQEWQETIDETMDNLFENIARRTYVNPQNPDKNVLNMFIHQLRYLENYSIPLDIYRNIYNLLKKHFQTKDVAALCKQNLNLLLSDTLNSLNSNKTQLTRMPVNPNNPMDLSRFSPIQQQPITTTEPLVLVQSGAGTGKSTTILGRINYMIASGIDPDDITVLSFTNAAANHILDICPNVHSMTIARMIHTIYTENFNNHELSSIETIINSIDIYYDHDQIARDFQKKLEDIKNNKESAFTSMNNFVEYHYDDVISILNRIKQTCLEMEIIICYQQINNFKEPAEVQCKYLIIDEVQDNSVFEFIYSLKYVDKHKISLFIVGKLRLPTLNPTNAGKRHRAA